MNGRKSFSINSRIRSFGYAIQGLKTFFITQHNAWIEIVSAIVVIVFGFIFKISDSEWRFLIIAISLVLITEMLNTAFEFMCDFISPQIHPKIKMIKDIAAGAVFISAITAVTIGLIIFLPKIL